MRIVLITLSSIFLSSCGIGTSGHPSYFKAGGFGLTESDEVPGFACPNNNNIRPNFDYWLDGSGYFKACASETDENEIWLEGNPGGSSNLVLYPVEYISTSQIFLKDNPLTIESDIYSQEIGQFSEEGIVITFGSVGVINAMFVVDAANKNQMDICLAAQDYYFCPPYSFGKFK